MWKFLRSKISKYKSKCARCVHIMFWGQILKQVTVLTILGTPAILVWYWNAIVKILRGGQISCLKNRVLGLLRARCVFGARQVLRQTLVTYKTFVSDRFFRLFLIYSKNVFLKMGLDPPPPPLSGFRHFCAGTYDVFFFKNKIFILLHVSFLRLSSKMLHLLHKTTFCAQCLAHVLAGLR